MDSAAADGSRDNTHPIPQQPRWKNEYDDYDYDDDNDDDDQTRTIRIAATQIMTKSRFSFMELPVEIRLKICSYLLLSPEEHIAIPKKTSSSTFNPTVSILQTCKLLNEEATPLLYSHNQFVVNIGLASQDPNSFENHITFPSTLRWTTIALLNNTSYISQPSPVPRLPFPSTPSTDTIMTNAGLDLSADPHGLELTPYTPPPLSIPQFTTTGKGIMRLFSEKDFSSDPVIPVAPDETMARCISNWVSRNVFMAALEAAQRDLEGLFRGPTFANILDGFEAGEAWNAGGGGGGNGGLVFPALD
ncbi:hypothetical protein B7463_g9758, partial [Scytalidium lignicola]